MKIKFYLATYFACILNILLFSVQIAAEEFENFKLLRDQFVKDSGWGIPYPQGEINKKWLEQKKITLNSIQSESPLKNITNGQSLKLEGNLNKLTATFSTRLDRVVTHAKLKLHYIYSPALLAKQSQVKIYLNDEVVDVIGIDPSKAGQQLSKTVDLPSYQFSEFNQITFELIGYYDEQCNDPSHSAIWFEFLNTSELLIEENLVALKNDLSLLPAPFFDKRQFSLQQVPFVFPEKPSISMKQAAGQVAAWLGVLARWRGNDFSLYLDQLPTQHAIVFATNDNKPFFLKDYPDVAKPTVVMVSHPLNNKIKLLLVLGANDEQLTIASKGLVMGYQGLSGQAAEIQTVDFHQNLQPYDAPLWVRQDRPMKFIEMVDYEKELQKEGAYIEPINLKVHIPADLFVWQTAGVPVDLKYRFTPSSNKEMSKLNVYINEYLVQSFDLTKHSFLDAFESKVHLPLSDQRFTVSSDLLIPSFKLGYDNIVSFDFVMAKDHAGCLNEPLPNVVAVDGDSTMDFSGFYHYAEMPNLAAFTYSGLPFTRLADLSETVFVLPEKHGVDELEMLYSLIAKLSAKTGYPGINFGLTTEHLKINFKNRDIILINALAFDQHEPSFKSDISTLIKGTHRSLVQAKDLFAEEDYKISRFLDSDDDKNFVKVISQTDGDLAIMTEFESPFTPSRTVLALMSNKAQNLSLIKAGLQNNANNQLIKGSSVLFHHNKIVHINVGDKYYTGELPVWAFTQYHLSQHPFYLLIFIVFSVLVLSIIIWRFLKYLGYKRLHES
jgi:hypothetical protein